MWKKTRFEIRKENTKMGFEQSNIRKIYRQWSKTYEWLTPIYLLGNEAKLRQKTIQALILQPSQSVLDLACGTGRNFPLILDLIGPHGKLIGVDYTPEMLVRARKKVSHHQRSNVQLIRGDATNLQLEEQFDAVLCTLAMSVIPNYERALERMLDHLKPGGWISISDAQLSPRWYARPFNWISNLMGWGAAADISRTPWKKLSTLVENYSYQELFFGFFYIARGQKKVF